MDCTRRAKSWTKRLHQNAIPRWRRTSLTLVGGCSNWIAAILSESVLMPSPLIKWPKCTSLFWKSMHLPRFKRRFASRRLRKTSLRRMIFPRRPGDDNVVQIGRWRPIPIARCAHSERVWFARLVINYLPARWWCAAWQGSWDNTTVSANYHPGGWWSAMAVGPLSWTKRWSSSCRNWGLLLGHPWLRRGLCNCSQVSLGTSCVTGPTPHPTELVLSDSLWWFRRHPGNVSTIVVASRPLHRGRLRKGFLSLATVASGSGWICDMCCLGAGMGGVLVSPSVLYVRWGVAGVSEKRTIAAVGAAGPCSYVKRSQLQTHLAADWSRSDAAEEVSTEDPFV